MPKEYRNRWVKPLINPPIVGDTGKEEVAIRHCKSCGYLMDTTDETIKTCFACWSVEMLRKAGKNV